MYIEQYANDALSLGFRIVRMQNMNSLSLGFTIHEDNSRFKRSSQEKTGSQQKR